METCPREGVMKEEKFPNTRKPSHRWVYGEFWNFRGGHNREEKGKKQKIPQITCLTATPNREVAQMLTSANGDCTKRCSCMFRVRTGPECPKDNLRELM